MKTTYSLPMTAADVNREELAASLSITTEDARLVQAAHAFIHARQLQQANKAMPTDRKELRRNVDSMTKALERIQKTLRHMPEAHYLDDHYSLANNNDTSLMLLHQNNQTDSGFAVVVDRLLNAVEDFAADTLDSPGKGSNKDTTYTLAIIHLADYFEQAFPENTLGHNKGDVFANFAGYWLASISSADPRRHIETALNLRRTKT